MRTSDQTRPETLLAAMNTFFADMVILPPAVLAQEERPFQPPLLASAHRQSCLRHITAGLLSSGGGCARHTPVLRPPTAHGWKLLRRYPFCVLLGLFQFLAASAVVDNASIMP